MRTDMKRLMALGAILIVPLLFGIVISRPQIAVGSAAPNPLDSAPDSQPQQIGTVAQYVWSYAVKFVCGQQPPSTVNTVGEPPVKPGNYATEINIHNGNYKGINLRKKIVLLVEKGNRIGIEPNAQQPRAHMQADMGADFGMFDDCNSLWNAMYPASPIAGPMPLMIGYLVILSPLDIDVDAVYTAEVPGTVGTTPTGISIDVNRVTGKRVYVPAGAVP